jgi:hypothetical protein
MERDSISKTTVLDWIRSTDFSYTARKNVIEVPYDAIALLLVIINTGTNVLPTPPTSDTPSHTPAALGRSS